METAPGAYLLDWERSFMALAVADVFGFHALQLGLPELDALATNRMPHRWLANETPHPKATVVTDFAALPFPASSLDLVVLPHALELTADPHTALSEVARVLVPDGRVVICGFNPMSLWGFRQQRARLYQRLGVNRLFLPQNGEFISYLRCRDWLRLLSFEIQAGHFGCYRPAMSNLSWLHRFAWMDKAGARWWPFFGAVYGLIAVKRVRGMTLLNPAWSAPRILANAPVSVANSAGSHRAVRQTFQKQKMRFRV